MYSRYNKRGVSIDKKEVHSAIEKLDTGIFPNSFCKVVPDTLAGDETYCNIMHADGVGTKSSLAYVYWKEIGDLSVWKGIAQDAIAMNLNDLLCSGVVDNMLLSSIIGRNKKCIPQKVLSAIIEGTEEILEELRENGIHIYSTGGETADIGDLVRTIVVDCSVIGRVKRSDIILNKNISEGDIIVGLASSGKAKYEDSYNSGIGSNGLASARHDILKKYLAKKYPESYDKDIPETLIYSGSKSLTDPFEGLPMNIGQLLLSPTRIYTPIIKEILNSLLRSHIHGMIHCTGSGQKKILRFTRKKHIIKNNLFRVPPIFRLIQEESGTDYKEMYQVFNMGHLIELYLPERYVQTVIDISRNFNVEAQIIGHVEDSNTNMLTIQSEHGEFSYS